jgi:hypothetical protein
VPRLEQRRRSGASRHLHGPYDSGAALPRVTDLPSRPAGDHEPLDPDPAQLGLDRLELRRSQFRHGNCHRGVERPLLKWRRSAADQSPGWWPAWRQDPPRSCTRPGDNAQDHHVVLQRRRLAQERPRSDSDTASPSRSTAIIPSRRRTTFQPAAPCSTSFAPGLSPRISSCGSSSRLDKGREAIIRWMDRAHCPGQLPVAPRLARPAHHGPGALLVRPQHDMASPPAASPSACPEGRPAGAGG